MRTTLFVAGFGDRTRARDLAYEFERYGPLVRCDIPAPKSRSAKTYAFVEYEDPRDAEDAYYDMQGRRFDGFSINIQWARNAPSRRWRFDRDRSRSPPRRSHYRSPSPRRRRSLSRSSRGRSPSRLDRSPPRRRPSPSYSRSPRSPRSRSRSPVHRHRSYSPRSRSPSLPRAHTST